MSASTRSYWAKVGQTLRRRIRALDVRGNDLDLTPINSYETETFISQVHNSILNGFIFSYDIKALGAYLWISAPSHIWVTFEDSKPAKPIKVKRNMKGKQAFTYFVDDCLNYPLHQDSQPDTKSE